MKDIEKRLDNIIKAISGNAVTDRNISLLKSGIINSMTVLQLIMEVEKDFGILISEEELKLENFETYDSIMRLIIGIKNGV